MIVWICGTLKFKIEAKHGNCSKCGASQTEHSFPDHRCPSFTPVVLDPGGIAWELNGIFSQRHIAVRRCRTALDFIAPVTVDESLPVHTTEMKDCEYPYADCRCKDGKRSTHCKWHGSCTCGHGAGPCPSHDEPERFEVPLRG